MRELVHYQQLLQEELVKKIKRYLNAFNKLEKVSLTFIISSHSYVWQKNKDVEIHNINEFKEENLKKEHKNVFI